MKYFYVSDLDGTLLGRHGTLSERSRSGLQELLAEGIAFSVASARSVVSMQPILSGLRLTLPVIEFNGAFLSDLATGHHEIVNALEPGVAEDVFGLVGRAGCAPFVATFNGRADCLYYRDATNPGEHDYVANRRQNGDHRLRQADDLAAALREQVVCLTVIGNPEPLGELAAAITERHAAAVELHLFENRYSPGWYWLTIHDRRATKDQAVRLLAERYDLAAHSLVAFGDELNDLKLLRSAAEAVAVANAHPEVRRHASQVIGPHDDDSVVAFIRNHRNQGKSRRK